MYLEAFFKFLWHVSGGSRGGGSRGSGHPLLGHDVGFLTLGPKLDPALFSCRPKMDPSGGSRVCVCDRGDYPAPPWNVDDVTRAMSKEGGACECPRVGVFFKFSEGGWRHADNVQGGVLVKNPVSAPGPPPFKNPGSAPACLLTAVDSV